MNTEHIVELWALFSEYLNEKVSSQAAEQYIEFLVEMGTSERALSQAIGHHEILDAAIRYYFDETELDEE